MKNIILALIIGGVCLVSAHAEGTFSRLKNWSNGEVLTASDLNAEFDNILNNLDPAGIGDYSENTTDMRSTADPYPGSSESLATSLQGELERLRYQILQLKRSIQISSATYWYEDTPSSGTLSIENGRVGVNQSTGPYMFTVKGSGSFGLLHASATSTSSLGFPDGSAVVGSAGGGQMESETAQYIVTPNVVKASPGVAKAWVMFTGTGTPTIQAGYNVSSISDNAAGDYTLNFTTPFSSDRYVCVGMTTWKSGSWAAAVVQDETNLGSTTSSAIRINTRDTATQTVVDPARVFVVCYGDQ